MTDLARILPDFPVGRYANLLPTIEKYQLSTSDLLTLQVADIGKRTQLPLLDVKRLCAAVLNALHKDLGTSDPPEQRREDEPHTIGSDSRVEVCGNCKQTGTELLATPLRFISTLDDSLDRALGGGVPAGYVTEITGESGAGKTQFLLTLLLACQLPPPRGFGRPALYISTEAPLSTRRLSQILAHHPYLRGLSSASSSANAGKPSLDGIVATVTPDLESQDHILNYQVPVEVARRGIGLLVLDSVAANYRAEFERGAASSKNNMAARSHELARLGQLLHELAQKHGLAVVVANQVADRFASFAPKSGVGSGGAYAPFPSPRVSQDSPLAARSKGGPVPPPFSATNPLSGSTAEQLEIPVRSSMPEPPPEDPPAPPALLLDHQQRWFTGWGDDFSHEHNLKTPSLGLVWSTQIAARVVLFRRPVYGRKDVVADEDGGSTTTLKTWRRWVKVVFAPHVAGTGPGIDGAVEFEVTMGGLRAAGGPAGEKKEQGEREEEKAAQTDAQDT
ncbi:DNA repair protein RAD57 [Durotheca rogersii]|uniref:DNA repair protein RAD57 n=1 Tax=Durotheca rogersii TaxID=419775 RepID=UPI00221EC028|nr:DNA repair protein RAD57 [Durotheca rogersii]KAI5864266.1 DNA repair protein RAD57 [Durotheca rogersii]